MSQSLLDDIVKLENFVLKLYTYGEPRDKIGVLRRDLRSVIPKVFEGQLSSLCVFHSFDLLRDTEGLLLLVKQFEDKSDTDLTVVDHFALGCSYVALDKIEMAQHHLQIAADLNCAPAKTLVGIMYESGVHFARDLDTAIKFYVDATNFGSAEASYRLGIIYGHGLLHIAKNFEMAMHYLAMSAEAGYPKAKVEMFCLHEIMVKNKKPVPKKTGKVYTFRRDEEEEDIEEDDSESDPYLAPCVNGLVEAAETGDLNAKFLSATHPLVSIKLMPLTRILYLLNAAEGGHRQARIQIISTYLSKGELEDIHLELIKSWIAEGVDKKDLTYEYFDAMFCILWGRNEEGDAKMIECAKKCHVGAIIILSERKTKVPNIDEYAMRTLDKFPLALQNMKKYRNSMEHVLTAVRSVGTALKFAGRGLRSDPKVVNEAVKQNKLAISYFVHTDAHNLTEYYIPYMIKHQMYPILTPYDFPKQTNDVFFKFEAVIKSKKQLVNELEILRTNHDYVQMRNIAQIHLKLSPDDCFHLCVEREAIISMDPELCIDTNLYVDKTLVPTCEEDAHQLFLLQLHCGRFKLDRPTYPPSIIAHWFSTHSVEQIKNVMNDLGENSLQEWSENGWVAATLLLARYYLSVSSPRLVEICESMNIGFTKCLLGKYCEILGDLERAREYYQTGAYFGDGASQYYLGKMYYYGVGGVQSDKIAIDWISRAAVSWDRTIQPMAVREMKEILDREKQRLTFLQNLKLHQNHVDTSSYNVAIGYLNGIGVKRDLEKALEIFVDLATRDDLRSMKILLEMKSYPNEKRKDLLLRALVIEPSQQTAYYPMMKTLLSVNEIYDWYVNRLSTYLYYYESVPKDLRQNKNFVKRIYHEKERLWGTLDDWEKVPFLEIEEDMKNGLNRVDNTSNQETNQKQPKPEVWKEVSFDMKNNLNSEVTFDFGSKEPLESIEDPNRIKNPDLDFTTKFENMNFGGELKFDFGSNGVFDQKEDTTVLDTKLDGSLDFSFSDHSTDSSFVFGNHEESNL